MSKRITINKANTQGHAFLVYGSPDERLDVLVQYFKQGLANNELCVFASADSQKTVIQKFMNVGFDIHKAISDSSLRIYEMKSTYVPNGKFVTDYMLNNVRSFIKSASHEGYKGLRTAGEMGWLIEHAEAVDDAIDYEHKVNSLSTPDTNFIGLCLYPAQSSFDKVLQGAAHSHPSYIYDGQVLPNPDFIHA